MVERTGRRFRALFALAGTIATGAGLDTVIRGARSIPGKGETSARIESELRFYSAFYVAYGAVLLRTAARADRDTQSVRALSAALFAGGTARAAAWARTGKPTVTQRVLLAIELAGPLAVVAAEARLQRDRTRPPGPWLPTVVQTAWMLRDPVRFLERCAARYGPMFRVHFLGYPNWVYVTRSALAREVYATDRTVGLAGPARRDFLEPVVGEHSLLCLDGDAWLRQRKLIGPAFHRRRVDRYEDEIASIARTHIDGWPREGELQLRPLMQAITLDVIVRLVLGARATERDARLRAALPEVIDAGATVMMWALPDRVVKALLGSSLARRVPHPLRRFLVRRHEVDTLIYAEIADRRRGTTHASDDVLSDLVAARDADGTAMSDIELRDELMTLLEAGHETTATALSWAVERLVRTPAALQRLEAELEAGEDTYLDAVVRETLRARSVVLDTPRLLSEPAEIAGYVLPAGTYVAPALPLVQHDAYAFDDPEEFRPERFLDGERGGEGWVPFGGGKRHCVGSHLALLEMKVILRETLRAYALEAVDAADEPSKPAHVTLVPGDLARVRVRRR